LKGCAGMVRLTVQQSFGSVSRLSPSLLMKVLPVVFLMGMAVAAVSAPTLNTLTGGTYDFGDVRVGQESPWIDVFVGNTGPTRLEIYGLGTSSNMILDQEGRATSIGVGQTTQVRVKFVPGKIGSDSGEMSVATNFETGDPDWRPPTLRFIGNGLAPRIKASIPSSGRPMAAGAGRIDFGMVGTGSSQTRSVKIENTGNFPLTISAINVAPPFYHSVTLPTTVAAGSSLSLGVRFQPIEAGEFAGSLTITSDALNSNAFEVSLKGFAKVMWWPVAPNYEFYDAQRDLIVFPQTAPGDYDIMRSTDGFLSWQKVGELEVAESAHASAVVDKPGTPSAFFRLVPYESSAP